MHTAAGHVNKNDRQLARESAGFLAVPRELFRACWKHLRLKEIVFLMALIDLADGRWTMPIALAELARVAGLSAGNARETAAHLERAGLLRRTQTAPGVYRWELAAPDRYVEAGRELAHRPRLKAHARPAQTSLPFFSEPPPMPPPRLALVPPPLPRTPAPPPAPPSTVPPPPEAPPTEKIPELEPPDPYSFPPFEHDAGGPDTIPAPPPCPTPPPPAPLGPATPSPLGLSLGELVRLASLPLGDDEAPPPPAPPARALPLPFPPQIGAPPAPNRGASPPQIGAPPRPKSGRPLLMTKPSDKNITKPVQTGAHAREADGRTDGEGKLWEEAERAELVKLAVRLAPGLHPAPAAVKLAVLEAQGATPGQVERFLSEEIPRAVARGATYPFAAALSRWTGAPAPAPRPAPPLPPAAPPPLPRGPEARRLVPTQSEAQREANRQGARAALAALRGGTPAPRLTHDLEKNS